MCSQYEIVIPINKIPAEAKLNNLSPDITWDNHIYPYSSAPVILRQHEQNTLKLMSYSLIPHWSKTSKPKFTTYNARLDRPAAGSDQLELIYDTPTWKQPFRSQRCIVPLTGFFESCREGRHAGNIVKFSSSEEQQILYAAGVWNCWTDMTSGEVIDSFAILTDEPIPFIREVGHDRQPVFLNLEDANTWLNHQQLPAKEAYHFLKDSQQPINYDVKNVRPLKGFNQYDLFN